MSMLLFRRTQVSNCACTTTWYRAWSESWMHVWCIPYKCHLSHPKSNVWRPMSITNVLHLISSLTIRSLRSFDSHWLPLAHTNSVCPSLLPIWFEAIPGTCSMRPRCMQMAPDETAWYFVACILIQTYYVYDWYTFGQAVHCNCRLFVVLKDFQTKPVQSIPDAAISTWDAKSAANRNQFLSYGLRYIRHEIVSTCQRTVWWLFQG